MSLTLTLTNHYEAALAQHELLPDPAQAQVIHQLQQCTQALLREPSWTERLGLKKLPSVRGLYLWGGVGRGKTKLMDLFFECLPIQAKKREHFHAFMRSIHQQLALYQGETNPLDKIAKALAEKTRVLCLDEFFVDEIGDAMILANLLAALFNHGLTLIITSNLAPNSLYANGLQRGRFLPAIALIEHHCLVHELVAGQDYRRRPLTAHELWLPCPSPGAADQALRSLWRAETHTIVGDPLLIDINQRKIPALAVDNHMAWFRFKDLCAPPRSQQDYLVLSQRFHTLIVSDIPVIPSDADNAITYFIYLIDILYDTHTRFIAAAAATPEVLYAAGRMLKAYERTQSRLIEMQSVDYQEQHRQTQIG